MNKFITAAVALLAVGSIALLETNRRSPAQSSDQPEIEMDADTKMLLEGTDIEELKKADADEEEISNPSAEAEGEEPKPETLASKLKKQPFTKKEKAAISAFAKTLSIYSQVETSPKNLIKNLKSAGLDPIVATNSNPDGNNLTIIRTKETLDGTCYFHAQYFEDEEKKPFLQHLSFEVRPGPDSLAIATKAVEKNFKGLTEKRVAQNGYTIWEAPGGYIVWISEISPEDMKDDPFNAYSPDEDRGTLRIVVEQDIH